MIPNIIYVLSTAFIIIAFLFTTYHYKKYGFSCVITLFSLAITQVTFSYLPELISNMMYDIAILMVAICIIKNRVILTRYIKVPCPLSDECVSNPNHTKIWYDKKTNKQGDNSGKSTK